LNQQNFKGRIISQHHSIYRVLCEGKELSASVCGRFRHDARTETDFPVVGDWVIVDRAEDTHGEGQILSVLPRRSLLTRTEAGTRQHSQAIAANLDYLFICMSCNRDFNLSRLERYISIAAGAGITPVAVLTKSDLTDQAAQLAEAVRGAHSDLKIIVCSSSEGTGLQPIRQLLQEGVTAAFVGSSGAGKSTLTNALLGDEVMRTHAIREDDARGRHTTTHRQLLMMPNGCAIIDTPGMRTLSLDESRVADVFDDIEQLVSSCRFGNCSHGKEPGCAVQAALADGSLDTRRWESYCKLSREEVHRRGRKRRY